MKTTTKQLLSGLLCLLVFLAYSGQARAQSYVWAKGMGSTGNERGSAIVVDALGNVYTIGNFTGTVDFDPGAGTANLTSAGNQDIFVSKLDASGNFVWAKGMGGTNFDSGGAITLDASGNVYTTGYFQGTVDFDPGMGITNLTSLGNEDVFVSKLDASGNFVWARRMGGGTGSDVGGAITLDAPGNVYTTGYFQGTVDFNPGVGTSNLTAVGSTDIFVSKLDASGNFVWAKRMGGTSTDLGNAIAIDASGNVYTTGYFQGIADFNPGTGTFNLTPAGFNDVFISKLDGSGNFVWAKHMGGTETETGQGVAVDALGNVYTTGYFQGTVDFNPGVGTSNLTAVGSTDIFVSKLDASGNFVWAKNMGSGSGNSIAVDASGNAYTTGQFVGTVDFDPGVGTANLTSAGSQDIFVSKLDGSGNFVWAKRMGSPNSDIAFGIALDVSENVYTTGFFEGTSDFDPESGTAELTSAGNNDVFVSKLSPPQPEINLQGNAQNITDGDASPTTVDHTNFGATGISTPFVRTFTIQNTGTATLNITSIGNTNATDFTVGGLTLPTTVSAGSSKTFTVTLNSATMGTKNATITVNSDDANESAYDFAITGTVINATPSAVRGNMMSFDGVNGFINAGDINLLDGASAITFETWLYIPTGTWQNFGMIMSKQNGGLGGDPRRIEFTLSATSQGGTNDLLVVIGGPSATDNANYNTNTDAIQYDTWYHVAIVFDGTLTGDLNRLKIYINGVQQTGLQYAGTGSVLAQTPSTNSGALCMGARQSGSNRFRGNMDEVRVWNTARTQAQIRENMHLTLSGVESGLLAYYQFNETSGTTAIDAITGNNGTLNGGASRVESTVSVAKGVATRQTVSTTGNQTFGNATVNFTAMSAPAANDEFVTYQMYDRPLNNVSATSTASNYWIVRQFGTQTFSYNQMSFTLPASNVISTTAPASDMKLFKRNHNSGGAWGTEVGTGTSADNTTKVVNYTLSPVQTSFSEFSVASVTSPLPITLLGLKGGRVERLRGEMTKEVRLEWATASEINNKGFEVEMSENGRDYTKIAFIEGRGHSTTIQPYNHTTIQPYDSYYRLKQVDFDGKFSYSPIVFVEGLVGEVVVYPNPSNGAFTISVGKDKLDLPARLLNAQGTVVATSVATGQQDEATKFSTTGLSAGVYFLHTTVAGKTKVTKIVIQ